MPARSIRILVAEDYPPFRRFLVSTIQNRSEWRIICEAEDGQEAVRKAEVLQPELVLLDVGLPTLNGIEAARQIRKLSPDSKILFVSQESSAEIVQAALDIGARGYVAKADAGRELVAALDAVLRGQTFVSKSLAGHLAGHPVGQGSTKTRDRSAIHGLELLDRLETRRQEGLPRTRCHEVGFYPDDRSLLDGFVHFIGLALKNGNAAILIATQEHRQEVLGRLRADGLDMSVAIEQGRYITLDNAETLSTFMVNDLPDPVQFLKVTRDLIARTAKSVGGDHARIAACGECAPLLWERGNTEGAVRLERLWDAMARSYGVQLLCGYPLSSFQFRTGSVTFERICAEHSAVLCP
jgi:DNA-binding NarL/FixJ family response regulator